MIKNLDKLKKAQSKFEKFRQNLTTEQEQVGAIQAFEFCYELAWKTIKKFLESENFEVTSPKDTFRKAAINGIISNPEIWFDFQNIRNITVHTYEEDNILLVLNAFDSFSIELEKVIINLEKLNV